MRMLKFMQDALVPLYSYRTHRKAKPTGIAFFDSSKLQICHNLRILKHQKVPCREEKKRGTGSTASNYTLLSMIKVALFQ